jgi:hypothetical protein
MVAVEVAATTFELEIDGVHLSITRPTLGSTARDPAGHW